MGNIMLRIAKKYCYLTGVLSGMVLFISGNSETQAACVISGTPAPATQKYPLPFNRISPNVHNDNVLLSVTKSMEPTAVRCASRPTYWVHKVENTSGTTGVFVGESPVYKTNIEGLGVYFQGMNANGMNIAAMIQDDAVVIPVIDMRLIKLTNSTLSGVLDASTLPTISFYATESSSGAFNSSAVQLTKLSMSGIINYVVPSCSAENKEIWLGEFNTAAFTGSSATPWVDASVVMTCDRVFNNAYSSVKENFITGTVSTSTRPDHFYSVSLESVNGFTDSARGIMEIDSGGATGVGIQISRTQSEQAWSAMNWIDEHKSTTNTFKIPLYARLVQTGSTVTSGQTNSKLIYTVQYK
ncbi:fimbrial protein [Klebsiella oxytoca]|uniref:fimbrial protein n=1 Tax=Klebsiella oxytoca TaxID=571 RepID=UPI001D0E0F13|nr:hypothetical protein [Klebsiella oxytoca]